MKFRYYLLEFKPWHSSIFCTSCFSTAVQIQKLPNMYLKSEALTNIFPYFSSSNLLIRDRSFFYQCNMINE
jgi:hypothetical protein